jgi:ribosomal protein L29
MQVKELREKTLPELQRLLADTREHVRMLRFGIAAKQVRNVREIRCDKKLVAQILTVLSLLKREPKA